MFLVRYQQTGGHPIQLFQCVIRLAHYGRTLKENLEYKDCYRILGVPEDSDAEQIREAYLHLAQKHHPDRPDGDLVQFQRVDAAFRTLLQKAAPENEHVVDIRHTAPQHRQYLSDDGMGSGTPSERRKQRDRKRVQEATDHVRQHRLSQALAGDGTLMQQERPPKHPIQTMYGFDRLVEDLIQEAMAKGEFSNLRGSGKPLRDAAGCSPHTDFVTYKINQVLIDNGFSPEWIRMQKEIRVEVAALRADLAKVRATLPAHPLRAPADVERWQMAVGALAAHAHAINRKIDAFNLVVPILSKQMVQLQLQREADHVLRHSPPC